MGEDILGGNSIILVYSVRSGLISFSEALERV